MDAVKFQKELARMCKSYAVCVDGCPLYGNGCSYGGEVFGDFSEKRAEIVEKWSKEHPLVTNGDVLKEMLPDGSTVNDQYNPMAEHIFIEVPKDWWKAEYREQK